MIPPHTNFGMLREAARKSFRLAFRLHFHATIGTSVISQDEFVMLLALLTPDHSHQSQQTQTTWIVLIQGYFLVHSPLTSFSKPELTEVPSNHLDRWQENQELLQRVRKRWSTILLSGLQPRTKWAHFRRTSTWGRWCSLRKTTSLR